MGRRILLGSLAALLLGSLLAAPSSGAQDINRSSAKPVSLLFSVSGQPVTIDRIEGTNSYRLRMSGSDNTATWFADRPVRESGSMSIVGLVNGWKKSGFIKDPPNSALVLRDGQLVETIVVKATNPKYRNGVFAVTVTPIESKGALPGAAESASLFIDNLPSNWLECLKSLSNPPAGCPQDPGAGAPIKIE